MPQLRPRTTRRALAAAALATTTVLGLAPAASAESVFVTDPVGDAVDDGIDLTSLRVNHRPGQVFFRLRYVFENRIPRNTDVWIDTGGSPAPDRVVTLFLEVEPLFFVSTTTGFGRTGREVCRLRSWTPEQTGETGLMTFSVPRRCLGDPSRLRTSLRTYTDTASGDWIPAARTFGPWVRAGRP